MTVELARAPEIGLDRHFLETSRARMDMLFMESPEIGERIWTSVTRQFGLEPVAALPNQKR
jgi:hypothetical protein